MTIVPSERNSIGLLETVEQAGGVFRNTNGRAVGLVLPHDLDYDTYEAIGRMIAEAHDLTIWCFGDWVAHGEDLYDGDRYAQAAAMTGKSVNTIQNWASLARKVPPQRRQWDVSPSVYMEVKSLPPNGQKKLLARAAREHLTKDEVRGLVKQEKGEPLPPVERDVCESCGRPL